MTAVDGTAGRPRTWPWVGAVAVALLALAVPIAWLPRTSQARADDLAVEYESALVGLRGDLAETQEALAVLTEPSTEPDAFRELLPSLSRLQEHTRLAQDRAAESLPHAWPLAPSEPLEALRDTHDALAQASDEADSILDDLVGILNYRTAVDEIYVIEPLPLLPPRNFDRFKAHLADIAAAEAALLDELPRPGILRDHAAQVRDAVERLDGWTEEYANALWIGETPTAVTLLKELRSTRLALDTALSARLAAIRTDVDARILDLSADLEEALAALEVTKTSE